MNNEIFRYNILEKPISLQSYCFLLNFVGLHNVNLINKISEPIIEQLDEILVCTNHSLKQLNMIGNGNEINYCLKDGTICSVLSILNKCKTKMGKRAMNEIILNPICNPKKLNEIYNNLDYILDKKYVFDHFLNDIKDYEKILTKIKLNRITPNDIFHIIETHKILENILKYISKDQGHGYADKKLRQMFKFNEYIKKCKKFVIFINKIFNLNICQEIMSIQFEKYDENDKLIKTGYNDELDNLIKDKLETKDKINSIVNYLETLFVKKEKVKSDYIKKNYTSVGELILTLTKNRSKILNEIIKKQNSTIELKYNSSYDNSEVIFLFTLNNIYFRDF